MVSWPQLGMNCVWVRPCAFEIGCTLLQMQSLESAVTVLVLVEVCTPPLLG